MKQDIERIIEIPEGVEVSVSEGIVEVGANGKEDKRDFSFNGIEVKKDGSKIKISAKGATKRRGKIIGTIAGHIKNMLKGVKENYIYKLEICNVHFPMSVKVEGGRVVIKSFLGETVPRYAKIVPDANVETRGNEVVVSSHKKEAAGQTAANIEKATKLTGRDRRIFQDGIFITEKPGRKI